MKKIMSNSIVLLLILLLTTIVITNTKAQTKQVYNVAIFLYDKVELLDFAGPGEVFASTKGFNVYTVSTDGKEILSQGFVTVKPQYSIDDAPKPDIIIFPGGNSSEIQKNQKVLNWVTANVTDGNTAMSVCSGASILAKAGLLEGLNVTTHHGFIPGLQKMLPNSTVLENTRFVDNGNIITTAGVSAGIDGALHMVARIKGMDEADATAWYMEYEKWDHNEGRVDYTNPYIEKMEAGNNADATYVSIHNSSIKNTIPYAGELKNLANDLAAKGMYEQEIKVLNDAVKWYPNESSIYNLLSQVYEKTNKPAPVQEKDFIKMLDDGKVDEAIALYEKTQKEFPGWKIFGENAVNGAGYRLLQKGDKDNAVKVFQLNVQAYPDSWNVYDSLGEGLLAAGDKKNVLTSYRKSLELNPGNTNAQQVIKSLL